MPGTMERAPNDPLAAAQPIQSLQCPYCKFRMLTSLPYGPVNLARCPRSDCHRVMFVCQGPALVVDSCPLEAFGAARFRQLRRDTRPGESRTFAFLLGIVLMIVPGAFMAMTVVNSLDCSTITLVIALEILPFACGFGVVTLWVVEASESYEVRRVRDKSFERAEFLITSLVNTGYRINP